MTSDVRRELGRSIDRELLPRGTIRDFRNEQARIIAANSLSDRGVITFAEIDQLRFGCGSEYRGDLRLGQ